MTSKKPIQNPDKTFDTSLAAGLARLKEKEPETIPYLQIKKKACFESAVDMKIRSDKMSGP